jgi:hypothetical protein
MPDAAALITRSADRLGEAAREAGATLTGTYAYPGQGRSVAPDRLDTVLADFRVSVLPLPLSPGGWLMETCHV